MPKFSLDQVWQDYKTKTLSHIMDDELVEVSIKSTFLAGFGAGVSAAVVDKVPVSELLGDYLLEVMNMSKKMEAINHASKAKVADYK